ncbi:hypothetical protein ACVXZ4_00345 [Lacisediminihabitans sp. FW035]
MKRTLAAITTIVIAVGIAITGVSTATADDAVAPPPATTDVVATDTATVDAPAAPAPASDAPAAVTPPASDQAPVAAAPAAAARVAAPAETAPVPEAPSCISDPWITYTYDKTDSTGTVRVYSEGAAAGSPLCSPLAVRAASWLYDLPTTGDAPSWSQTLEKFSDVNVDSVGTFSYSAPNGGMTCRQFDIYASFAGFDALALPTHLIGAHNPFEPPYLAEALDFRGPPQTYFAASSRGCDEPVIPTLPLTDPTPVTFVDTCGTEADTVVIPALTSDDHFTYSTSETASESGARTVTVTAAPDAGYGFSSDAVTSWSHTFKTDAQNNCVTIPGDPEAVGQTCAVDSDGVVSGYLTVAPVAGVVYTIHPVTPTGADITVTGVKTNVAPGEYLITAAAEPGFILSGVTEWQRTVEDNAVDCSLPTDAFLPSSVSWVGQTCSTSGTVSGYIAIDPTDFLSYFVGTTQLVSARTAFAPGTYVVTVTAPPGDTIDGPSSYTATITKASTSCGNLDPQSLTTLAFTGFDSGAGYIAVASGLLMLGAALVFGSRRKAKA